MKSVTINKELVNEIAAITSKLRIRESFYQRDFLSIDADREIIFCGFFAAVAICHQTHHLKSQKKQIYGWDYLEEGFVRLMLEEPDSLTPKKIKQRSVKEISNWLAESFSDSGNPKDTTLDRLEERAYLLKEMSEFIVDNFGGEYRKMLAETCNKLFNGGKGVYEVFPEMEAFKDPLQKKTTFLLKLLQDASLFTVQDEENLYPVMDYHMMRMLLRTGAVDIHDSNLKNKLRNREPLDSDYEIRAACAEAMKAIGLKSGHGILKMNDFYWTLGRSCCAETTLCHDKVCAKSPCTFHEVVDIENHERCALQSVCRGAEEPDFRRLWQPMVQTHFY
ncbi:MAG: queuosine salvage family protein [Bacteroidota bacterium]